MDRPALTLQIQAKLADGRLPHNHIPRMWGGPGNGETCDGCGETVSKSQMVMEGLSVTDAVSRRMLPGVGCGAPSTWA
jgi:hypothetical protein